MGSARGGSNPLAVALFLIAARGKAASEVRLDCQETFQTRT